MPLTQEVAEWVGSAFASRDEDSRRYRAFYDGQHKVALTDRLKEFLKVESNDFNSNFCEVIVDVMVSRLAVTGFEPLDEEAQDTSLGDWISDLWEMNRMDLEQRLVHSCAAITGDSYVMVDFADDTGVELLFNDSTLIRPHYDPLHRRRLLYVAKRWVTGNETFLNIYYPDRIEKFAGEGNVSGGSLTERQDEGEQGWPVPWVHEGEPIGIPVIHFANKPGSWAFGRSELVNAIPLQNALNKTLADSLLVADTLGFQQRYTINAKKPPGGFKIYPGAVWNIVGGSQGVNPTVGQFPGSDPMLIMGQMEGIVNHMAATTMTPQHSFKLTDNFPSGEALKTAEQTLVTKVKDRQVVHGTAWENVIYMARRVAAAFGQEAPGGMISTLWADPETRNELQHMQTLKVKLELGVPQHQIWRELGYTEEQIEQMQKDVEAIKISQGNVGAELMKAFNGGQAA